VIALPHWRAAHSETLDGSQEADVYALTLVNGNRRLGAGLRHSDVDCLAVAAQARQGDSRTRTQTSRCDLWRDVGSLAIGGRPLSQLTNTLSTMVGKTVVDQTGLTGNFDVHLKWTQIERHRRRRFSRRFASNWGSTSFRGDDRLKSWSLIAPTGQAFVESTLTSPVRCRPARSSASTRPAPR
jgi:uncharacterized protein (TIGR03435 family)